MVVAKFHGSGFSAEVQFKKELYFSGLYELDIYIYIGRGSFMYLNSTYMGPTVYEYHLLCTIWSPRVLVCNPDIPLSLSFSWSAAVYSFRPLLPEPFLHHCCRCHSSSATKHQFDAAFVALECFTNLKPSRLAVNTPSQFELLMERGGENNPKYKIQKQIQQKM